ncbi:hypothetical protein ABPG74_012926 [Tetrahymena malaccensis]
MVKALNRKTSIQFPISRSNSSSDKNTSFPLSFKCSLKCKSENNIGIQNQLVSQKISEKMFLSNQEILFQEKIDSSNYLELNCNQLIKSQFCINSKDDLNDEKGDQEKFFTFQKQDQLRSKAQGFFLNTDINFQIGETYLSDSYDTLEAVSQYLNFDHCQETSIMQDTHANKRLEYNQKGYNTSLNTDSLEESKENNLSSMRQAQNTQILFNQIQQEEEEGEGDDYEDTSSNKSYFSFHPKITLWKEENWSQDPKFEELQQEKSQREQNKQFENSKNILSKVLKIFTFSKNIKSEQQININVSSEESFQSFKQKKQNQVENDQIKDKDQTLHFDEDLEWLDNQLERMKDPNMQSKNKVFEFEQLLESNQKLTQENSSEQLNLRQNNQQENSFSKSNINAEITHSDDHNYLPQIFESNPIENLVIKPQQGINKILSYFNFSEEENLVSKKAFICNQNSYIEETLTAFQNKIYKQLQKVSKNQNIDLVELIKNWKNSNYEETYLQSFSKSGIKSNQKSKLEQLTQTFIIEKNWMMKQTYCQICTNTFRQDCYSMKCQHQFCKDCYTSYMLNCQKTGKKLLEFKCPQEGCQVIAEYKDLTVFFSQSEVEAMINQAISEILNTHNSYSKCPSLNCDMVQKFIYTNQLQTASQVKEKVQRNVDCSSCFQSYCNICKQQSHLPLTCSQFNELGQSLQLDNTWILKNTKNCPECFSSIEKNQGCSHMICFCCKYEFCWECLDKYVYGHLCNKKQNQDISNLISLKKQKYYQKYIQSSEFAFNLKSQISRCLYFQHLLYENEFENTFQSVVDVLKSYKQLQIWSQIYSNQNLLLFLVNKDDKDVTKLIEQQDELFEDIQLIQKSLNFNFDRLSSGSKFYAQDIKIIQDKLEQMKLQLLDTIKKACLLNSKNIKSPQLYCLP